MGIVSFPRNTRGRAEVGEGREDGPAAEGVSVFLSVFPRKAQAGHGGKRKGLASAESQQQGFGVTVWECRKVPWGAVSIINTRTGSETGMRGSWRD